jgi:hypothetical protein
MLGGTQRLVLKLLSDRGGGQDAARWQPHNDGGAPSGRNAGEVYAAQGNGSTPRRHMHGRWWPAVTCCARLVGKRLVPASR